MRHLPLLLVGLLGPTALNASLPLSAQRTEQAPPAPVGPETARVGQVQGKYVFCYTQPVAAYDVAFSYQARITPTEQMSLNTIVAGGVTAAFTEAGIQQKTFDAILIQPGDRDLAIKFRDDVPQADRALATVRRNQGKLMFLYCEPVQPYQVVKTEKISWYNHAFGGAYYTFGRVEQNLLKTASKLPTVDGILFGETASYITLSK